MYFTSNFVKLFTGEDAEDFGGFLVSSPDCMVQDQSINNTKSWKNLVGGSYCTFIKRRPSHQYMGDLINDVQPSFENIS